MTKSLKFRTLLFGFIITFIAFSALYYLNYKNISSHHLDEFRKSSTEVSIVRSDFLAGHLWNMNSEEIKLISNNLLKNKNYCGVKISDENGKIFFENGIFSENNNLDLSNSLLETDNQLIITDNVKYKLGSELKNIGKATYCFTKNNLNTKTKQEITVNSGLIIILAILILAINFYSNNFIFIIFDEFRLKLSNLAKKREKITSGNLVKYNETISISNTFNKIIDELDETEKELILKKEAAETANRAKSEFLSNMSHELRTPIHAITNYAGMGMSKSDQPDKVKKYFTNINISGERLLILINNILDLSKIGANKIDFSFSDNNIINTTEGVLNEVASLFQSKNISFKVKYDTNNLTLNYDSQRIHQVILNILSNAYKFSPDNSEIKIFISESAQQGDLYLKYEISDQGVGIPESELSQIFDAFEQSSATKTGGGGTGLGLAICKEIIIAHKGRIWAENNHDKGAKMCFTLPYKN